MTTAVKSPKRAATTPRPDTSLEAIAKRREVHMRSLADSALEGAYPDPAADHIAEKWIAGEITSAERLAMIKDVLKSRLAR